MKIFTPFKKRHKPNPFVLKLSVQAEQVVSGAQALVDYMETPSRDHARRIRDIEHQADEVRRALIIQLNRVFITPIDREDLFGLSRSVDDVLDFIYSVTREMVLLHVEPNEHLKSMALVLRESARELERSIQMLELQPTLADEHARKVRALENRMDTLHITALVDLFHPGEAPSADDVIQILKLREIYRQMYQAVASAEQAANLINDIVVKFY